ncbi:pirin [Sugiyamaella lignohabitans]|uniref:Pirin n=1 Tax=Sugiyamaella lignohabitans TaxID=796027 RepID=A0A167F3D9_9ASCO|nr:pirin [Sugiyamaella lignohabitans]ANB14776.1 pirin [Sugiyamaella lignohabitans]
MSNISAAGATAVKKFTSRGIAKNFLAVEQSEGVGARVRRAIGSMQVRNFSPFLMMDHFVVGKNAGFPDHPHRGQETITYIIKGYFDHEDFTGSSGTIGPGDLQFMTAGRGIVHAEMPRIGDDGVLPEGMQLWVDLPKELKACEPRYRDLKAEEIPVVRPSDKVEIKVISGHSYGVESVKDLAYTPIWYFDVRMQPGGSIEQEIPKEFNAFVYVLNGNVKVDGANVDEHHCALLDRNGDGVQVSVDSSESKEARLVIIGGELLSQEIVQHGPFVETSREKIMQAFVDYQTGSNGFERARDWESKIGKRNG